MDDDHFATSYTFGGALARAAAVVAAFVAPVVLGAAGATGLFGTDQVWQRIAFVPLGLIVGAVYGYLALFRIAYRLRIVDSRLHWRAALRSGSAPLAEVSEVVPHPKNYTTVVLTDGRRIHVAGVHDVWPFLNALRQAAPHVQIKRPFGLLAPRWFGAER
ncbi:hypothetical protein GCM10010168_79410 [Actinoplanes ianthinogenes]|uniref:PH domain-containing protein n=1 Tax=Actinoplanes ianthinogenes TaxID=122358 RepID=A0ABN6C4S3_9ACTN|nr:hypothetical protein [Actinoplanes ianthinogenes]BCJ39604.1 hypothetical protein Aiant_02610 [Actinoplanes ianthinogenes]GGR48599.1 hypothetical protein GCM10010168_79410 [Actinoplanes ianthinogenes]